MGISFKIYVKLVCIVLEMNDLPKGKVYLSYSLSQSFQGIQSSSKHLFSFVYLVAQQIHVFPLISDPHTQCRKYFHCV